MSLYQFKFKICPTCDGAGICKDCNGVGRIRQNTSEEKADSDPCATCKGDGNCHTCEGKGRVGEWIET